jgi:hypothetical protein
MISEATYMALVIIGAHPGITPGMFAKRMWPDSPSWGRHTRAGHGSVTGAGIRQAGGALIGKMSRSGLVERDISSEGVTTAYLTVQGQQAITEYEASR